MVKHRKLSPQQLQVCAEYVNNGANKTNAYTTVYGEKASARTLACRLFTNVNMKDEVERLIQEKQQETEVEQAVTKEYIREELQTALEGIRGEKDRTNELRCLELLGKTIGIFKDGIELIDKTTKKQLEAEELKEAQAIAKIRLAQSIA